MTGREVRVALERFAKVSVMSLICASAPENGSALAEIIHVSKAHASVALAMAPARVTPPTWCYDTQPAFVYGQNRVLFRSDMTGNVSRLLEAPEYFGLVFCSQDGRTVSFYSKPDVRESTLRLTVLDVPSRESAQYLVYPPASILIAFSPPKGSPMSLDGRVFALPSAPKRVVGPDLLHDRHVIHTDTSDVFWTENLVFAREGERARYRIRRVSDLGDLGTIDFPADRVLNGVFECQDRYFGYYYVDALSANVLESIDDRRLGAAGAERFANVGGVAQDGGVCAVRLVRLVKGQEVTDAVRIVGSQSQTQVDMRAYGDLNYRIAVSKDGQFLLGTQPQGPIGARTGSRILVFRVSGGGNGSPGHR